MNENAEKKKNEVYNKLSPMGYKDNMTEAWCYAVMDNKVDQLYSPICNYLYYWIGSKITADNRSKSWEEIMRTIYEELTNPPKGGKCGIIYPDIDQTIFGHMKTLYEYYTDYGNIRGHLDLSKNYCDQEVHNYLDNIYKAYQAMETECTDDGCSKDYCTDFGKMFTDTKYEELLKKGCNTDTRPEDKPAERHLQAEGKKFLVVRGTVPAIFGTTTTIGLGLISLLLYKYNLLPSWISNYFRGSSNTNSRSRSNRGRRSFAGRHHLDDSTTIGDSTTNYSTTDYSTASEFDVQSTSTGRTTNNARQRQQQQRQRRNVGYHPRWKKIKENLIKERKNMKKGKLKKEKGGNR
ncbi:KIR-like CYIR protein [Plasmodium coatneyi]|uniref:KIR-like CYIR protein n=1 Tax=Plasmodium coatneyi TaxID=208452 RepID=A0A1B1E1T9_9APIC|nr:KIR-like CYIR protein [Plasmodium coatneyi]ANQ08867.1 KIR-like CYIR protein [Plasmodium coatneyi]